MVDPPTRYFVFEISDPIDESQSRVTQNIEEAQQAYERGFFVAINEVVQSFLSTKQKSNNNYYNRLDRKDKPLVDKQKLLNRAHDRVVLSAIHQASNDIRQINKRETSEKKQSLETRIENIEKRLNVLEVKEKFSKKN